MDVSDHDTPLPTCTPFFCFFLFGVDRVIRVRGSEFPLRHSVQNSNDLDSWSKWKQSITSIIISDITTRSCPFKGAECARWQSISDMLSDLTNRSRRTLGEFRGLIQRHGRGRLRIGSAGLESHT